MGLIDFIKKQFINVIEMPELGENVLVKKFEVTDSQIQYGAQLIVRESQVAIFINEGKLADIFQPGTYTLTTKNLPILTNLKNWDKLFESPFKADVYFINQQNFLANPWGTTQPVTIRDKEFDLVRVRSFGKYGFKIQSPENFLLTTVGLKDFYSIDSITPQLKNTVLTNFTNFMANSGIPFIDLAANQLQLAELVKQNLSESFSKLGLEVTDFLIESFNVSEEIQKVIDTRTSMKTIGNLDQYMKFQVANSIPDLAKNEGAGLAAMGAGFGLGNVLAQNMTVKAEPTQSESIEDRLVKAKTLLDKGLITDEDYDKLKKEILSQI